MPSNGGFKPRFQLDGSVDPESVSYEEFVKRKFQGDSLAAEKIRGHPLSTHLERHKIALKH